MSSKNTIIDLIYEKLEKNGSFLRPDIYKESGIRTATVLEVVDKVKSTGLLIEPEGRGKKSGRKASELILDSNYCCLIGIDFKINYTAGVIIDFQGNVIYNTEIESGSEKTFEDCQQEIAKVISGLKQKAEELGKVVRGIGFADPGVVDVKEGVSLNAVNIDGWKEQATAEWLKNSFDVEDALVYPAPMARAFFEYRKLPIEDRKSLFLMALGVGVGGAFIKDNQMFTGDNHSGMEIGHVVIAPEGPLCICGNRGCLEAIAGVEGIRKRVVEICAEGVHTELSDEKFSIPSFVTCVKNNDKVACGLAHEICEQIGKSVSAIVAILNPSMIILSGKLAELDDILLSTVKRTVTLSCLPASVRNLQIKISEYDRFSTAEGAAVLLRNKILKQLLDAL